VSGSENTGERAAHPLKLTGRAEVAERTLEFRFERPPAFNFKAGQFMDLTLVDPPETDGEGNTRAFSINSAPDDAELIFATRLRDTAFKRVLQSMPLGTVVAGNGPFGNLTLHNDTRRPAVLLAGGIGITPFRSITRWASHRGTAHRILLFYGNRRPEDAPFLDEFRALAQRNPRFTFVPTMSQAEPPRWSGETGYVDARMIAKYLAPGVAGGTDPPTPVYYIAGPPPMVAALHAMLNAAGVDDDDLRTEDFAGY